MKNENRYYVCVSEGLELQDEFFVYIGMLKDYLVEIAEDEIDRQFRELYPDRYSRMHVYLHNEDMDYEYRLGKRLFRKGLLRHAVNESDATYLCEMYRWFSYHRKSKPFIQKSLLQFKLFVRNQKLSSSQQDVLRHVLRIVNGVRKLDDNIEPSQPSTVPQIKTPPPTSAPADYSLCLPQTQAATGVAVPDTTRAEQAYIEDSDGSVPRVEVVNQLTKDDLVKAQYEAALLVKYADKVDEWHIISKTKYNGTGWAKIVDVEEAERIKQGHKPRTVRSLESREETIRRSVEAHREKLGIQR